MVSSIKVKGRNIPVVGSRLTRQDHLGTFKTRWGIHRMNYTVDPGVYALGSPTSESDVFVTANYKLSFDKLRSALAGISAWILVLDTKGINVWCAAGKRTFSTAELVRKISVTRLSEVVSHWKLIVPQLGAPGIAAHEIKKQTGFKVVYGPIRATDIPAFIASGNQATPAMRQKDFSLTERIVLIPMELIPALKYLAIIFPALILSGGFFGTGTFFQNALTNSLFGMTMLSGGLAAGAIITPAALPWLPGKSFSFKGMAAGLAISIIICCAFILFSIQLPPAGSVISMILLSTSLSSFLGMNFTGASTYTSPSGVMKEMKIAVPLQILAVVSGIVLWIGSMYMNNV